LRPVRFAALLLLITRPAQPPAVRLDELRAPGWRLGLWSLSPQARQRFRTAGPGDEPIPFESYQREDAGITRIPSLLPEDKADPKARTDGKIELASRAWAGGRILAFRANEGLWVETLTFGSGVNVAGAQLVEVLPELRGEPVLGERYGVPASGSEDLGKMLTRMLLTSGPRHSAVSLQWTGDLTAHGAHGTIVKFLSKQSATDPKARAVRISYVCQAVTAF
jgi:hypothetical protein